MADTGSGQWLKGPRHNRFLLGLPLLQLEDTPEADLAWNQERNLETAMGNMAFSIIYATT